MKINDREIAIKANGKANIEGVLHYQRPQNNDWSTWYSAPSFKERRFKLVHNLLFYFRSDVISVTEPLGLLVLENAMVRHEKSFNGVVFPFSIEFEDEPKQKYIFSCRNQAEANNWVAQLRTASYEYWRTQLVILQKKISMRTGYEPVVGKQVMAECLSWSRDINKIGTGKSTFQCHLDSMPSVSNLTPTNALCDLRICEEHLEPSRIAPNPPYPLDIDLIQF